MKSGREHYGGCFDTEKPQFVRLSYVSGRRHRSTRGRLVLTIALAPPAISGGFWRLSSTTRVQHMHLPSLYGPSTDGPGK